MLKAHSIIRLILIALSFINFISEVQSQILAGVVFDSTSLEPLPYASIGIQGKSNGTVSNINGQFYLSLDNESINDTLICTFLGYRVQKYPVAKLESPIRIIMVKSIKGLEGIVVLSNSLSPIDILEQVQVNKHINYPNLGVMDELFIRKQTISNVKRLKIKLKKASIPYLDKSKIKEIENSFPIKTLDYRDRIYKVYNWQGKSKSLKEKGVFHTEGGDSVMGSLENDLEKVFNDLEGEGRYWKIRSGPILGFKLDMENDSQTKDSSAVRTDTSDFDYLLNEVNLFTREYIWRKDFVTGSKNYIYTLMESGIINGESVYIIDFKEKKGDLFGKLYITCNSYALVRIEYYLPPQTKGKGFKLFGVEYRKVGTEVLAYFKPFKGGYRLKYGNARVEYNFGINRPFSIIQKQRRFLWDKTLEEVLFKLDAYFNIIDIQELLVANSTSINENDYKSIKKSEKVRDEYVENYKDKSIWKGYSIIEPTNEMKAYRNSRSKK